MGAQAFVAEKIDHLHPKRIRDKKVQLYRDSINPYKIQRENCLEYTPPSVGERGSSVS